MAAIVGSMEIQRVEVQVALLDEQAQHMGLLGRAFNGMFTTYEESDRALATVFKTACEEGQAQIKQLFAEFKQKIQNPAITPAEAAEWTKAFTAMQTLCDAPMNRCDKDIVVACRVSDKIENDAKDKIEKIMEIRMQAYLAPTRFAAECVKVKQLQMEAEVKREQFDRDQARLDAKQKKLLLDDQFKALLAAHQEKVKIALEMVKNQDELIIIDPRIDLENNRVLPGMIDLKKEATCSVM